MNSRDGKYKKYFLVQEMLEVKNVLAAMEQDWQTWSAAMYLYAAECVKQKQTPFFDKIRAKADGR